MLSMIDENDLAEFIGEGDGQKEPEPEQPSVVIPETENPSVSAEPEAETEMGAQPEAGEKKGGMSTGALFAIVLLLAGGIGAFYYFKVWKPKQDEDESDGEDLEFYDGGAYINEDREGSDGEGEDE